MPRLKRKGKRADETALMLKEETGGKREMKEVEEGRETKNTAYISKVKNDKKHNIL